MIDLSVLMQRLTANRQRTMVFVAYLEALARHEAKEDKSAYAAEEAKLLHAQLAGRGDHIGWHLMHIAANEDASFGVTARQTRWNRYQHGRPRTVAAPPLAGIRQALEISRAGLLTLAQQWNEPLLGTIPPQREATGMTYREHLDALAWHEAYHLNECNEILRALYVE